MYLIKMIIIPIAKQSFRYVITNYLLMPTILQGLRILKKE